MHPGFAPHGVLSGLQKLVATGLIVTTLVSGVGLVAGVLDLRNQAIAKAQANKAAAPPAEASAKQQ